MGYADFVRFVLSEEDKESDAAARFWFRVLDLDGDGKVTVAEMAHFFDEQFARLAQLGHEPVPFRDVACQLLDAVHVAASGAGGQTGRPSAADSFTLLELRRSKMTAVIVDTLTNVHKFIAAEAHDVARAREMLATPHLTMWDRFAEAEYRRVDDEEEEEEEEWAELGAGAAGFLSRTATPAGAREAPF